MHDVQGVWMSMSKTSQETAVAYMALMEEDGEG